MQQSAAIEWRGLNYEILPSWSQRLAGRFKPKHDQVTKSKVVFNNLNGHLTAGRIAAIMGPSGAGKTCLIRSLSGQRSSNTHLSGSIVYNGKSRMKMAVIPQDDPLLNEFTVQETLTYASRLKNTTISNMEDHKLILNMCVESLGLQACLDTKAGQLSGGERRRLSIGTELVSQPDVLLLDEPTTGLDSSTALSLVTMLRNLARQEQLIIAMTIHQPSSKIFALFQQVYIMSPKIGAIYEGSAADMVPDIERIRLPGGESGGESILLPAMTNPAEWVMDIAVGEYGDRILNKMVEMQRKAYSGEMESENECDTRMPQDLNDKALILPIKSTPIIDLITQERRRSKMPFWKHLRLHTMRSFRKNYRDTTLVGLMISYSIFGPVLFLLTFGHDVGTHIACPSIPTPGGPIVPPEELAEAQKNYFMLLFVVMLMGFSFVMSAILTIPLEIQVTKKEWHNGWYRMTTYFLGHTIAQLPLTVSAPIMFLAILFPATSQSKCITIHYPFEFCTSHICNF